MLTNLSTTNATYLNERAVSETAVSAGDRIRIGKVRFRVEAA